MTSVSYCYPWSLHQAVWWSVRYIYEILSTIRDWICLLEQHSNSRKPAGLGLSTRMFLVSLGKLTTLGLGLHDSTNGTFEPVLAKETAIYWRGTRYVFKHELTLKSLAGDECQDQDSQGHPPEASFWLETHGYCSKPQTPVHTIYI